MRLRRRKLWRPRRNLVPPSKSVKFAEKATILGEKRPNRRFAKRPPDGGWSWVVLLGIFCVNVSTQSLFAVSGLLLGEAIWSWGHGVTGVAAATTIMVAVQNFSGLASGVLTAKWHARTIGVTGSLLVFVGLVLTSRATKLWIVFLTWGLMVGIGMGMIAPTAFLIVTHYFERYRRYAIGISVAGTGLGQMLYPLVLHELFVEYQFSGACLIIASISLQGLPGFLLCRPIVQKPRITTKVTAADSQQTGSKLVRCRNVVSKVYHLTGFSQLSNPVIANTIICTSLIYTTVVSFTAVTPLYLRDRGKLTPKVTAQYMTLMSSSDLAARIILPIIQEKFKISARSVLMTGALIGSLSRSVMEEVPHKTISLITIIVNGISRAATVLNVNMTCSEMVPRDDLMSLVGASMVCKAVSILTAGTLLGWLHDLTGNYKLYIHTLTLVVAITFVAWLLEMILIKWRQNGVFASRSRSPSDSESALPMGPTGPTVTQQDNPNSKDETEDFRSIELAEDALPIDDITQLNIDKKSNTRNRRRSRRRSRRTQMLAYDRASRALTRRRQNIVKNL